MLRFLCCCCYDDHGERQPLLQTGTCEVSETASARQTRPTHSDTQDVRRIGKLVMRRLNVPELDQRFYDMAETFNAQQESHEAMVEHIRTLTQSCNCTQKDTLSFAEIVDVIREKQKATYKVSLVIKGYDFSLRVLRVSSEDKNNGQPLPPYLQIAQDSVKGISESAKATKSKGTALQEMIRWLLHSQDQMVRQVNGAAETYQEQGRLAENLEENMKEVRRAKELSQGYRKQVEEVQIEAAQIANTHL